MLVAPDIHRIEAPFGPRVNCTYLLVGADAALLVDTGIDATAREYLPAYLTSIGLAPERIRYVVTTHCDWDHVAGAGAVRELAPRAEFCCHESDRLMTEDVEALIRDRYSEFEEPHGLGETDESLAAVRDGTRTTWFDVVLRGGETFDLGDGWRVEVLHTPGHSHGSISVYDPRSRAVIIGDAVLGIAVPHADGTPAFPPTYRYVDEYERTINSLQELASSSVLTSHYPVYDGDLAAGFLGASADYVQRVDTALRDALARHEEGLTMRELIDTLGSALGDWPAEASQALVFPFAGHLERMEEHGLVTVDAGEEYVRYRPRGQGRALT